MRTENAVQYALALALGIVIGFGVFWSLTASDRIGGSLDIGSLSGALTTVGSSEEFKEIGVLPVKLGQVYGDVRLHESKEKLVAEVSLSSLKEIQWALKFDRKEVVFDGFRQVEGKGGNVDIEMKGSGELKVDHVGRGRYVVFFMEQVEQPKPMTIEILDGGKVIYENDLTDHQGI